MLRRADKDPERAQVEQDTVGELTRVRTERIGGVCAGNVMMVLLDKQITYLPIYSSTTLGLDRVVIITMSSLPKLFIKPQNLWEFPD